MQCVTDDWLSLVVVMIDYTHKSSCIKVRHFVVRLLHSERDIIQGGTKSALS
jgi:hypothetical protein